MRFGGQDGVLQGLHAFLQRRHDLLTAAVIAECILGEGLAQALQHAVVVDDQAEVLARKTPVGAGDGLHQGVRPHRLVDVQRRQAFDVEAGQPHGADDRHAERVLRIFERRLHVHALAVRRLEALLHPGTMGNDVETPFPEIPDLVLRLADDDLDDRLVEPGGLGQQAVALRLQALAGAPQRAGRAEGLPVPGDDAVPAQRLFAMGGEGRLDQAVFAVDVGVGHACY